MTPARAERSGVPFDLLVAGHTNLDHLLRVQRLPELDRTVPLIGRETRLGGTAANIARVAARLGVRTALHSYVGPDFPPEFRRKLRADGVDLEGLVRLPGTSSPACYITEADDGAQVTLIDQGAMAGRTRTRVPDALIARSRWVHIATGDPAYQLQVLRTARQSGQRVAADPAQEIHYRWNRRDLRELLESSEIFFANASEAERARRLLGIAQVRGLPRVVPLVVITLGSDGAVAYARGAVERVPGMTRPGKRHTTGAGDAFRGGFYAAWLRGEPLRRCVTEATRTAARWVATGGRWGRRQPNRGPPRAAYTHDAWPPKKRSPL